MSGGQSNVGISGIDIETLSTFVARLSLFPVQIYTLYNLKANMNQIRTLFELFCTLRYFCFRENMLSLAGLVWPGSVFDCRLSFEIGCGSKTKHIFNCSSLA